MCVCVCSLKIMAASSLNVDDSKLAHLADRFWQQLRRLGNSEWSGFKEQQMLWGNSYGYLRYVWNFVITLKSKMTQLELDGTYTWFFFIPLKLKLSLISYIDFCRMSRIGTLKIYWYCVGIISTEWIIWT